jgi:glutathione S-transferase
VGVVGRTASKHQEQTLGSHRPAVSFSVVTAVDVDPTYRVLNSTMTSTAAVAVAASIVRPTAPTLFHTLHFSSSRPLFVLYELGVVAAAGDDCVAATPDAKKAKTTDHAESSSKPPPVHVVHITYEQLKNDPILSELNPQKRLPFYYDPIQDLKLTESGGLVEYLLETYDVNHTLHPPPNHATRADFLSLLHFGPATAYHIGVPILFPGPDVADKKKQWHDIVAVTLERSLEKYGGGPYLLGDQFSAVDAVLAYDLITVAASTAADELFKEHPTLKAYHALLQDRPAYQKTFPPSDDEKEESK